MATHAKFVTVEGIEGVGKSTAMQSIANYLKQQSIEHVLTREPGGTGIAEHIRSVLLSLRDEEMADDTELLLMFAARAQHIARIIKPALEQERWVVSDRFTDASFAYQGGGRGMALSRIKTLADWVQGELQPDLTIILDAPVALAMERISGRGKPDRIESEQSEFFERVRQVYLDLAASNPQRYRVIDASQPLAVVHEAIIACLAAKAAG